MTEEEKKFGNFNIFSDPADPFSMYNFVYNNFNFDRLSKLMEYNTLNNLDVIKSCIEQVVRRRQQRTPQPPVEWDMWNKVKNKFSFRKKSEREILEQYILYLSESSKPQTNSNTPSSQEPDS